MDHDLLTEVSLHSDNAFYQCEAEGVRSPQVWPL